MSRAVDLLESGVPAEHAGYQLYASVDGAVGIDAAGGVAGPGRPMTTESLSLWFSSGKPIIAVAVAQLWERGLLGLDDPVRRFLPEFANGKESATIRHLLTHRGGFPFADDSLHPPPWPELVAQVCAAPAMWPPGEVAAYHGTSGWVALAEVLSRITGRPFEDHVREEIFEPLGMANTYLALPPERLEELRGRIAWIHDDVLRASEGMEALSFEQFNDDEYLPRLSPGNTARGPARELGRLFEALLAGGRGILHPVTVDAVMACHRLGFEDQTYAMNGVRPHPVWGLAHPWALGMSMGANADMGDRNSTRVVGSSGAFSSVAFADPESGLVCVIVTTGLLPLADNERRLAAVANAVHDDLDL